MPDAGWNNDDISSRDFDGFALVAAEPKRSRAAGDAEHLMNHRVIVNKIVNPVAPRVAPAVQVEDRLRGWPQDHACG